MSARFKNKGSGIRMTDGGPVTIAKAVAPDVHRAVGDAPTILTRDRRRHASAKATTPEPKRVRAEAVVGHAAVRRRRQEEEIEIDPRSIRGDVIAVVVTKRPWLAPYVGRMLAWQSLRPKHVVVCSALEYDIAPIEATLASVPVLRLSARADASLGEMRNMAMDVASTLSDTAILCTIDDDDSYGVDYLAGIVHAWQTHPIALCVGLGSFETQTVAEAPFAPARQTQRQRAGLRAPISGATISVPSRVWRERTDLRYPTVGSGEDIAFLKRVQRENRVAAAYFGDFVALRYTDPAHGHTSNNQGIPTAPR